MPDLRGSLEQTDLRSVARSISEARRTGTLRVAQAGWSGDLAFDRGRLVGASIGDEHGQSALELIALGLAHGEFDFVDGPVQSEHNLDLPTDEVRSRLEALSARARQPGQAPVLHSVPRVTNLSPEARGRDIALSPFDLAVLRDIDGHQTVQDMTSGRSPGRVLETLARLGDMGLIRFDLGGAASGTSVASEAKNGRALAADALRAMRAEPPRTVPPRGVSVGITAVVLVVALRALLPSAQVADSSMLPELQSGQLLLVNQLAYASLPGRPLPARGDLVVFRSPGDADGALVRRVIGLPGERVRIERGVVYINDQPLPEGYLLNAALDAGPFPTDGGSVVVPNASYFVLADNRATNLDSRMGWFVPLDSLVGRAWLSYWPPSRWGPIGAHAVPAPISAGLPAVQATPRATPPVVQTPLPSATPVAAATVAATATAEPAPTSPSIPTLAGPVVDQPGWPNHPGGTAWRDAGVGYRLFARDVQRFVAVGAPLETSLTDVAVNATFRKVGGPPGGGYGIVLRDQAVDQRQGSEQGSRFYVAEVGDRGEFGIWRRDEDHWVDLVPWTPSDAVRKGGESNSLTVRAEGARLTLIVNGTTVASVTDSALPAGRVGAFAGGDLNEVVLDQFAVEPPTSGTVR